MKKKKMFLIALTIILFISILTISYALWTKAKIQTNPNQAVTGCFDITIENESNNIHLTNAFPISDENGLKSKAYTFYIENTCTVKAYYQLNLEVLENSTLSSEFIKLSLNKESPRLINSFNKSTSVLENTVAYLLKESELNPGERDDYSLWMWMDQDTPQTEENKTFQSKVTVNASSVNFNEYADNSGAEAPVLNDGMIPVTWDGSNWIKADTTQTWYNYDKQWWANAVNVTEESRNTYINAKAGETISMNDILFMWVWVPRYEYRYDNLGMQAADGEGYWRPGGITINFISSNTLNPSANNFYIHDAFWWDRNDDGIKDANEQLPGIWVAKFELSQDIECDSINTKMGQGCDLDTATPHSKPNKQSWTGAFLATYWAVLHEKMNGDSGHKMYGLNNMDVHMIKNMEWGAVAYLSQSKYGKYGNEIYAYDDKEIYGNNTGMYENVSGVVNKYYSKTGCSAGTSLYMQAAKDCTYTYDIEKSGTGASTTGNIYGIYDMSGGAREYVMAFAKIQNGEEPSIGDSGFSGKKYDGTQVDGKYGSLQEYGSRYYDLYEYAECSGENKAQRYHPGDATYEMTEDRTTGWYSDTSDLVSSSSVLVRGGGTSGVSITTGIFYSYPEWSYAYPANTTRAIAVPLS